MTGSILFFTVVALVSALVFLPLFRSPRSPRLNSGRPNGRLSEIDEERQLLLDSLRELEFERQLGKVPEEEYVLLREGYRKRAIALLKAADEETRELDSLIEAEVRRMRESLSGAEARRAPSDILCPACSAPVQTSHVYCPTCGASLRPKPIQTRPRRQTAPPRPTGVTRKATATRASGWLLGGLLLALIFTVGVAGLYATSSRSQSDQRPVGQIVASDYHALSIYPGDSNILYFGHHNGLQTSADGGRSWTDVPGIQGDVMAVLPDTPVLGSMIVGGHNVLLRKSAQSPLWQTFAHNLPSEDVHAMARHPDKPSVIYAFVAEKGLFLTEDGGSNWRRLSDRLPETVTGIAVAPGQPDLIFVSAVNAGVQLSADGGGAWQSANGFVNGALPTTNVTAIGADPSSGDVFISAGGSSFRGALYAGTPGGLFKSTDGGGSWLRLPLDTDIMALAVGPPGSRSISIVNSKGQIFRSSDGGVSWGGDG